MYTGDARHLGVVVTLWRLAGRKLVLVSVEAVAVADVVAAIALGPVVDGDVAALVLGAVGVELAHGFDQLLAAGGVDAAGGAGADDNVAPEKRLAALLGDPALVGSRLDPVEELGVGAQVLGAADHAGAAEGLARGELGHALAGRAALGEGGGDYLGVVVVVAGGVEGGDAVPVAHGVAEVEAALDHGDGVHCC